MIELIGVLISFLLILLSAAILFYWLGKRAGKAETLGALENGCFVYRNEKKAQFAPVSSEDFSKRPRKRSSELVIDFSGNNQNANADEQSLADEHEDAVIQTSNYIVFRDDDIDEFRSRFQIKISDIELSHLLGSGYNGGVNRAKVRSSTVAVKRMNNFYDDTAKKQFWEELKTIAAAGLLPNVLTFLGFVESKRGFWIVLECCDDGDLLTYVRNKRATFEDNLEHSEFNENDNSGIEKQKGDKYKSRVVEDDSRLCTFDLLSFAYQIANGMKHLTSVSIIHSDLALRNVLVTGDLTIRIGDFGIARRVETKQYYRATDDIIISIHHAAPEVFENREFSEKTAVWAFGVTLFELFSLGARPYKQIGHIDEFVKCGGRLSKPEYCTDDIYKFMLKCWDMDPDNRPNFSRCKQFFEEHFDHHNLSIREDVERKLKVAVEEQKRLQNLVRSGNQ